MLNKLTTEEVLALAYQKGRTFDALAFAEDIARREREAVIVLIRQTLQDGFRSGMLAAVIRTEGLRSES